MQKCFLFFSAQYFPTAGGVERFTNNLARTLLRHGHRVIVVTSSLAQLPAHEIDRDGIEIFRLPSWPFMNGRLPLLYFNAEFRRTEMCLWANRIDYCIINTYFYPLSMYAARQVRKRNIPALILNHGSTWLMAGNKLLSLAGQLYERAAVHLCRHYCNRFFGVSVAAQEWMKTFSICPEGIITNAIDPDEVTSQINMDINWRLQCGLPGDALVIAFVGRMIPEKGVNQLTRAMATIRKTHPNAYLLMAGTGPLLEKYRDSAPDGVFLLGTRPYPDILALLKQANVFCLPSRSEGFACTVLEAAALGCPIITTATGGSPQLLQDPRYGILLENMEAGTISNACIQALDHPEWCQIGADLTRKRLMECYTWEAAFSQLSHAFGL